MGQSLSEFQTDIGVAVYVTLDLFCIPEQLLLIALPLSRIILANALSKQVGNAAHILVTLLFQESVMKSGLPSTPFLHIL